MKKKIIGTIFIVSIIAVGFTQKDRAFSIAKNMDVFASLYKEVSQNYVDEVNPNILMNKSLAASLATLDPYTVYIPEDKIEDYRIENDGEYVGIGALTTKVKKDHFVKMVYDGYPAAEAGLKVGDKIISVDGRDITGKSNEEITKLVRGQDDTSVTLAVKRYGLNDVMNIEIKRRKVDINSVSYHGMVEDSVGYIKLNQFSANCGKHVSDALNNVLDSGATRLILDLRGNPGGFLHEAVNICNLFLDKGTKVVETKGKNPIYSKTYNTLNEPTNTKVPIVVLINKKSASASEIVSGVIQDYDRGVLVGEKSFGKGLVQKTWPLPYKSQLKATISKYYIPSGRCIQALDYNNRSADGKATKVADSLRNIFHTANGRKVFDGGGVSPDQLVTNELERTSFLKYLINEGKVIGYANKYVFENPAPASIEKFEFSDDSYLQFKSWLNQDDFYYNSHALIFMDSIISKANKSSYDGTLEKQFSNIRSKMIKTTEGFLERDQSLIRKELSLAIMARYFLEKGEIKYALDQDTQVLSALAILRDSKKYKSLLNKE